MEIRDDTSPELAIKIAYDFGRALRTKVSGEERFAALLSEHVGTPFAEKTVLPYAIAGFTAGFYYQSLPWRRAIEAKLSGAPLSE